MVAIADVAQRQAATRSKRLAVRLAVASALAGANAAVVYATGAILGAAMAPDPGLATVPLTVFVVGMAFGTLPVGWLARRYGRRVALVTGAASGAACGLIASLASYVWSFPLLCVAVFFGGFYAAASQSYRFAATDGAPGHLQPKLISWVMIGGIFAAFIGPQLVQWTADIWPQRLFAATYLGQAAVAVVAMAVLSGVPPQPASEAAQGGGRPLGEIVAQPRFIVAALCGTVGYALMNLVMTAAPLAMKMCGHEVSDSNLAIQWHVVAMFLPSFLTGSLIQRFGAERVVAAGLALIAVSAVVGLSGITVPHFWTALILLGVGWNFGFIGASAMVLAAHRPEERNKVQSFNDFLVFGTMAAGSFSSGQVLVTWGWDWVNWIAFPPVALALAVLALVALRRRAAPI